MKILPRASSIIFFSCFLFLAGCDSIHVPGIFEHDEVPLEIKAQPRLVQTPPQGDEDEKGPRLGDVPARPRNLTPKNVYEQHMEELEQERAASEAAKREILERIPVIGDGATQNMESFPAQQPPQFLKD